MIASTVAGCNKKKICDKFEVILNTAGGSCSTDIKNKYRPRFFKLDMKPRMHSVEMSNFSIYNVTVKPNKIMNRADKNWASF